MTRDEIIKMAREVWEEGTVDPFCNGYWTLTQQELERFADLVAAAEREACASLCDRVGYDHEVEQGAVLAFDLAIAIRARDAA
jgi:hypothetical protein